VEGFAAQNKSLRSEVCRFTLQSFFKVFLRMLKKTKKRVKVEGFADNSKAGKQIKMLTGSLKTYSR
jgi:hypothetical protein